MKRRISLLLALLLTSSFLFPECAHATLGILLGSSMAHARRFSDRISGATFWLKDDLVVAETWYAEGPGMKQIVATILLKELLQSRKLNPNRMFREGELETFTYSDGSKILFHYGDKDRVHTIEAFAPDFSPEDLRAGKYKKVIDTKLQPFEGKPWRIWKPIYYPGPQPRTSPSAVNSSPTPSPAGR